MVENAFGILVNRFRILLGTMGQRPMVIRDIVFTCVVLHNMLRTHQVGQTGHQPPKMMWWSNRMNSGVCAKSK